ncbi:hypothetical protein ACFX14_003158 [Malus domestica]
MEDVLIWKDSTAVGYLFLNRQFTISVAEFVPLKRDSDVGDSVFGRVGSAILILNTSAPTRYFSLGASLITHPELPLILPTSRLHKRDGSTFPRPNQNPLHFFQIPTSSTTVHK